MIDIHAHVLPGLDDGPQDIAESLEMLRIAEGDGIEVMIATPHMREGVFENTKRRILSARRRLSNEALNEGMGIELLAGADTHISADLLEKLEQGELLTLNGKNRHLLIELPGDTIPPGVDRILFELRIRLITPIITHPERSSAFHRSPDLLEGFIKGGCLVQITAASLTGRFGAQVRKFARDLLKTRLAHLIATDCHSCKDRPPLLSKAVDEASRIIGATEAERMVNDFPRRIVEGTDINPPEPLKQPGFLKRIFG